MAEAPTTVDRPHRGFRRWAGWRIGIVGHLGLSFAAVGVLAAIANMIVDQGVSIIEITRIAFVPVDEPRIEPRLPPNLDATPADLFEAVDRYGEAVVVRAQIESLENDARVPAAEANLSAQQADLLEQIDADVRLELERALDRYRDSGAALINVADQRRQRIGTYTERLRSLHGLLDQSVDRSWRIFGRVLARQAIVRLRADHDQLRIAFAAVDVDGVPDPRAVAALIEREAAFDATLSENERGLIRSEGREWLDGVRSLFRQLVALRAALVVDSQRFAAVEFDFLEARRRARELAAAVPERTHAPVAQDDPPYVGPPVPWALAFFGPPVLVDSAFSAAPLIDAVPLSTVTSPQTQVARQETDKDKQLLVAWVSGGVLLIVFIISIGTVRSIVIPIRRLLRATTQLGKYGVHEPVPRGGIKELDTLAQSFNEMAEELIASRKTASEYQQRLEQRVIERTRELRELAECDPLTGLPNRRHLLALLDTALAAAGPARQLVAVFFVDLDNFKNINDSMGHGFGDEVLKAIAKRLKHLAAEVGFAGRLGGDEFTVILTGAKSIDAVWTTGVQVIDAFRTPLLVGHRDVTISVSVGASIYPDHERTAEGLLKAADAALFRAKALGRNQISVYTPELLAEAATRFATEQGLRYAVERGDFELVFQPEVSADTLETELVEALVRWRMPDGRLASPGEFFAVAEESGLISEIGDWVLRSAVSTAAQWYHAEWPRTRVAINVSPRQLIDHRFVEKVQALLAEFAVPARCIEIELTETVLQTGRATLETLQQLHSLGFAIALDDFGAGYSSLASLDKLPFTRVKLDRSLIAHIATSPRSAAIARTIIRLCHDLNLEVTAEGVETHEQLRILMRHRPIYLQGHLLSKPVKAGDLIATLERLASETPKLLSATPKGGDNAVDAVAELKARIATRKG